MCIFKKKVRYRLSKKNDSFKVKFKYQNVRNYNYYYDSHNEKYFFTADFYDGKCKKLGGVANRCDGCPDGDIGILNAYTMPYTYMVTPKMIFELASITGATINGCSFANEDKLYGYINLAKEKSVGLSNNTIKAIRK